MASTSEIGHSNNVANFNTLISRLQGYGARYNPTNPALKIISLQSVNTSAGSAMTLVSAKKPAFTTDTNIRQQLFADMEKLSTRIMNAFSSTQNVTVALTNDAKTIIRKIRGARKNKIKVPPVTSGENPPETPLQISASQQSYDQQVEHFTNLISLVASVPGYIPNETELQNASLNTFLTSLKNANAAMVNSTTPYLGALQNRNNILYSDNTGLVDLALAVKKYVKSVKTITLAEYRQISGLKFTRLRKKK